MEQLLALIFENPLVAIIVAGALWSILKGSFGQQKQQAKPVVRPSPYEIDQQEYQERHDEPHRTFQDTKQTLSTNSNKPFSSSTGQTDSSAMYQFDTRSYDNGELLTDSSVSYKVHSRASTAIVKKKDEADYSTSRVTQSSLLDAEQLSRKNLQQAVLWSEILGPPRAKRLLRKK